MNWVGGEQLVITTAVTGKNGRSSTRKLYTFTRDTPGRLEAARLAGRPAHQWHPDVPLPARHPDKFNKDVLDLPLEEQTKAIWAATSAQSKTRRLGGLIRVEYSTDGASGYYQFDSWRIGMEKAWDLFDALVTAGKCTVDIGHLPFLYELMCASSS